ncbi:hypothetical protein ACFL1B_04705 [Nanoarchaeota archaeon]
METDEEQRLLEELHNKKKDLTVLNRKDLSDDELDELFAEA